MNNHFDMKLDRGPYIHAFGVLVDATSYAIDILDDYGDPDLIKRFELHLFDLGFTDSDIDSLLDYSRNHRKH